MSQPGDQPEPRPATGAEADPPALRLERLYSLVSDLSRVARVADVLDIVLDRSVSAGLAQAGLVMLVEPGSRSLRIAVEVGFTPQEIDRWRRIALDAEPPISEAVRAGEAVFSPSRRDRDVRWPAFADSGGEAGDAFAVLPLQGREAPLGAIVLAYAEERSFSRAEREQLEAIASRCAEALDRARLFERETHAREQLALVARAGAALAASLDYEKTLREIGRLAVPGIADWYAVDLLDEVGRPRNVAVEHADPNKVTWAIEARKRLGPPDPAAGVGKVIASGVPELYPEIPDELLVETARNPDELEVMRAVGFSSVMIVPLAVRRRVLGAITFVSAESGRRYTLSDLDLALDIARHAAVAIDNARLHAGEQQARRRAEQLQRVTSRLAQARTRHDVAHVLASESAAALGAAAAWVSVLEPRTGERELLASAGLPDGEPASSEWMPFGASVSGAQTERSADSLWLRSLRELRRLSPGDAETAERLGYRAFAFVPLAPSSIPTGSVALAFGEPRDFDDFDRGLFEAVLRQCALALERARLFDEEHAAREEAQLAQRRLELLRRIASVGLRAHTTDEAAAEVLAEVTVACGARAGLVALVEDERALRIVATVGYPRRSIEQLSTLSLDASSPESVAVVTGAPAFVASQADVPSPPPIITFGGVLTSHAALPLSADGRVFGLMRLSFPGERSFDDPVELELLDAVSDQCAQALQRSLLAEQERQSGERLRVLQRIGEIALSATSLDTFLAEVLAPVRELLAADSVTILMLESPGTLRVSASNGLEEDVRDGLTIPVGKGFGGRVAARRAPLAMEDVSTIELLSDTMRERIESALGVPLIVGGELLGVLHVGSATRRRFLDRETWSLLLAADRIALAIRHERQHERERRIAETLQRSMLPRELPNLAEVELAAVYEPAARATQIGGDWYDAFLVGERLLVLAIGDVVGKGVHAAAVMGQLRNALRAYASEDPEPRSVIERLNRLVLFQSDDEMATAFYGVVDLESLELRYTSAGHPAPILRRSAGEELLLHGAQSLPLGVDADAEPTQASIMLAADDLLALYTDGLVERRGVPLDAGIATLAETLRASGTLDEACGLVMRRIVGDDAPQDDTALLLVRFRRPHRLELRLSGDEPSLLPFRAALRSWLAEVDAGQAEVHDVVLATSEAVSNALEHGRAGVAYPVIVEAALEGDVIRVSVSNEGPWRLSTHDPERGRGIALMRHFMDGVDIVPRESGTTIHLRRELGRAV